MVDEVGGRGWCCHGDEPQVPPAHTGCLKLIGDEGVGPITKQPEADR